MKFAHIADTHIRNVKFHYEYREVFQQLYNSLKEEGVDYIIHCGDIAHTKTAISPEFVDMAREFFENLASIAPTYIILGNHDGNLKNSNRQDAITPIVRAMKNENIVLLKNAGEHKLDDNFCLNVLSVFDEENWTDPTDQNIVNIALYHGAIDKSKTDLNWTLGGDHDISIFDKFDFAFLGDIHKTQILDNKGRVRYAGSTVQQNFGESLDKGYLLWDIENKDKFTCKLITFQNPKPFITLALNKDGTLPDAEVPSGARLRLTADSNISLDVMRRSVDAAKYRYKPESITYLNRASSNNLDVRQVEATKEDLRDASVQKKLINEYLETYEVTDEILEKVHSLNSKMNKMVEESEEVYRNVNWSLQSLEWDGLFNYGSGNKIDFNSLEGIVGIFGQNFSGKSSIIDSLLYTLYNSTSKKVTKNLHVINQNLGTCSAKAEIKIGDKNLCVERSSEKYLKKLRGNETEEASTDLNFTVVDEIGNVESLNGTSRTDTDKNVRKYFGVIDDFLMTSMASQLDSLAFINDGSTKRKEYLAKFLDLEVFDKKFKLAKTESQDLRGALKRLEGIDFDEKIEEARKDLDERNRNLENNQRRCKELEVTISSLQGEIDSIQNKIDSAPTEIIDPVKIRMEIETRENNIKNIKDKKESLIAKIEEHKEKYSKISAFLETFDIDTYEEKKKRIIENRELIEKYIKEIEDNSNDKDKLQKRSDLLREVPCGDSFPNCKFIKDAHEASGLVQIKADTIGDLAAKVNSLGEQVQQMEPEKVLEYVDKYQQLLDKKNEVSDNVTKAEISIDRSDSDLFKENTILEKLLDKLSEYEDNKEAIENLEELLSQKKSLGSKMTRAKKECTSCKNDTNNLLREVGSCEQQIKQLEENKQELDDLRTEFAAYKLFMTCFHTNGISYDIIKNRLPIINEEIAKILTGVVDFEVFIQNEDKKLDIFIKHPKYEPRLLEMGSGAEKTISAMAIRLALLTVSSLPKPDIFILDEPGTALDANNMEGFIRIMEMVKSYFKTVILITHLDTLKDAVDTQITIDKKEGYAYVNV